MTEHRKLPRVNRAERAYLERQIETLTAQRRVRDVHIKNLKGARGKVLSDMPAVNEHEDLRKQIRKAIREAQGHRELIGKYEEEEREKQPPEVERRKGGKGSSACPPWKEAPSEVVTRLRDLEGEVSAALEDAKRSGFAGSAQSVLRAATRLLGSSRAMAGIIESSGSGVDKTTEEETEKEKGGSTAVHRSSRSPSRSPPPPPNNCAEEKKKIKALMQTLAETREEHRRLEEEAHRLEHHSYAHLLRYDALKLHGGATAFEPQSDFTVIEARPVANGGKVDEELEKKIANCKKKRGELEKALETQQKLNEELVDLDKQYEVWLTSLLEGGSNKILKDLEESRTESAILSRDIDIRTKELEMLLEGKELNPDELEERERARGEYSLRVENLVTEAAGFIDCEGIKNELRRVQEAMEKLRKENAFLLVALKSVVPTEDPEGADDELKQEIANLNALLAASERRSDTDPEIGSTTSRLKKELNEAVAAAAAARSKRIVALTSRALILKAQVASAQSATDPTRVTALTSEIAAVEARIAEGPTAADFALLSDLRAERLRLSPSPELHKFVEGLLAEATPAVIDLPDSYFRRAWEDLFGRVQIWCYNYYRAREDSFNLKYKDLVNHSHLLSFYLRDVLIHRDYVERLVPWGSSEQGRVDVATGIVFKILVEEVFEPIRFLLHLRFPDPSERWKKKPQYKSAFEAEDMASEVTGPRFQACESFLERKRKWTKGRYPEPEVFESVPCPQKRVKNSGDHFNFFRMFEDNEQPGVERDNDDDILLNTSRAKLMRSIFSLADDSANLRSRDLRADVSALITDTLRPLAVICTPAGQTTVTKTTWADDPRTHKEQLWKIIKTAYDLAIEMRTQRTIIHPVCTDLMSMQPFNASAMTIANHPSNIGPRRREEIETLYDARSQGFLRDPGISGVGCHLRPVCEVLPGLVRRGNPASGGYSWADKQVISKAKVYVGGPDDMTTTNGLTYTVHEFPYGLQGPTVDVP